MRYRLAGALLFDGRKAYRQAAHVMAGTAGGSSNSAQAEFRPSAAHGAP
jgi:hypothetical protein